MVVNWRADNSIANTAARKLKQNKQGNSLILNAVWKKLDEMIKV